MANRLTKSLMEWVPSEGSALFGIIVDWPPVLRNDNFTLLYVLKSHKIATEYIAPYSNAIIISLYNN